ncbi:hypothetical protein OK351_16260 [Glutamicibacter sp. MNS18]|uniref:hypothetical protein n=1 Tax=Glutamicibacter sp. MNS18 TaxID=2989817 RepID=UPI002236916F|nr:hypothetical protein [Glutamicibacter sp. MNS18]MCW4467038.1 hypothetical protein [Glutamicibacter sp. MNS18]
MVWAVVFTVVLGMLALFQLGLVFGAPWGRFTMGGYHPGRLPTGLRVVAGVSVLLYGLMALLALLALRCAGLVMVPEGGVARLGMWVVFGFLLLGVGMNAISRSKPERYVMTPVSLVLAVLALLVVLGV